MFYYDTFDLCVKSSNLGGGKIAYKRWLRKVKWSLSFPKYQNIFHLKGENEQRLGWRLVGKGAQLCRLVMMLRVLGVCNLEQDTDIGHPAHIGLQVYNEQ